MKKLIIGICVVVVCFLLFVYIFIPGHVEIETSSIVKVSPQAAARVLSLRSNWRKWWPGQRVGSNEDSIFTLNESQYKISQHLSNAFDINVVSGNDSLHSLLTLLPRHIDSVEVQWNGIAATSANPFERIRKYLYAKRTRSNMNDLVVAMKTFLQQQRNIYGIDIRREVVTDTLVAMKVSSVPRSPSTNDIYDAVKDLQTYIQKNGAHETNPPMVNIEKQADSMFRFMVAIPIDHEIPSNDKIGFRRLVPGYILVADVQGGPSTISNAFSEMGNYISDYSRSPVAIPFQSLITNRVLEQDTSKWKTRVYFPIIL
jgi:hypothetical protein